MQAKLPDVNAAIVRYRSESLQAIKQPDYDLAVISIAGINADLPEDYKVRVSTSRYNEMMKDRKSIACNFCVSPEVIMEDGKPVITGNDISTECILSDVKQFDRELGWQEQILIDRKTERVWICTKCGNSNIMDAGKIKIRRYEEPYYFGVMPSPPVQQRGVRGRNTFDAEFKKWFAIAVSEIESKIGLYRAEYAAQHDEAEPFDEEKFKD